MASLHAKLSETANYSCTPASYIELLLGPSPTRRGSPPRTKNQEATMGDVACLPLARQLSFTPMSEDEVVLLMLTTRL